MPTVFENYTASFEIDKHRIELNMWDTSGKTISRFFLHRLLKADITSIHSQPCHGACPRLWPWEDCSPVSNFSSSHPFDKLLWPCKRHICLDFCFKIVFFFLAYWICYLWLLSLLETSVPAMSLGALGLHSFLCCPLCVAGSSHALAGVKPL